MRPDLDALIREARDIRAQAQDARESAIRMRESAARIVERARAVWGRVERFLADHPVNG